MTADVRWLITLALCAFLFGGEAVQAASYAGTGIPPVAAPRNAQPRGNDSPEFAVIAPFATAAPLPKSVEDWNAGAIHYGFMATTARDGGSSVEYVFRHGDVTARLAESAVVFDFGASGGPSIAAHLVAPGAVAPSRDSVPMAHVNHYFGSERARWDEGAAPSAAVVYSNVAKGIAVRYEGTAQGLKYDVLVAPEGALDSFAFEYEGASEIEITPDGELRLGNGQAILRDSRPIATDDLGAPVMCTFQMRGPRSVGFECPSWNHSRGLRVDPLVYGSFVGGGGQDLAREIAVDKAGNIYIGGETQSFDFPTVAASNDTSFGGLVDGYVAKFDPNGTLLYSTYFGGSDLDRPYGVAIDDQGNIVVGGYTSSADFPTTVGAFDTTLDGSYDGYLMRLNATDGRLDFSTFLGGSDRDYVQDVGVGAGGTYVAIGQTLSANFPNSTGSFDPSFNGASDVFLTWFAANGSEIVASGFLGGSSSEEPRGSFVDSSGAVYVTGITGSSNFPISSGAFSGTLGSALDAFAAKVNSNGTAVVYATFLGGEGNTDLGTGIVADASGEAIIVGQTDSTTFPITAASFDRSYNGGGVDGFIARLSPDGTALRYSAYLGGAAARDEPSGVGLDPEGNAYVVGTTASNDFPTTDGAFDRSFNGPGGGFGDLFLSKVEPTGSTLNYSTFVGSGAADLGYGIAVVGEDDIYVVGSAGGGSIPTTQGSFDTSIGGPNDGWVGRLDTRVFNVSFHSEPPGFAVIVNGLSTQTPFSLPCATGSQLTLDVSDPPPGTSQRFVFNGWSDGQGKAHNVTCDTSKALLAVFETQFLVRFSTVPIGLAVRLDGVSSGSSLAVWWANGSAHNVSIDDPQSGGAGIRLTFTEWADAGPRNRTVIVGAPLDFTATFGAEFLQTLEMDPPGATILVDGAPIANGTAVWWGDGSLHRLSGTTPQNLSATTRLVFSNWSDLGSIDHTVTVTGPATLRAQFLVEFLVSVASTPSVVSVMVDGLNLSSGESFWWVEGSVHALSVDRLVVTDVARHWFASWSDGGAATHTVVTRGPADFQANFSTDWRIRMDTEPVMTSIFVDGAVAVAPVALWWADGSNHTVSVTDMVVAGPQVRFSFAGWRDGAVANRSFVASGPLNLTAIYREQFLLLLESPAAPGECVPADCWYDNGSAAFFGIAEFTAVGPGARDRFDRWEGDISVMGRNGSVLMDRPVSLAAIWVRQYELTVSSDYGTFTGAAWYDARTMAHLTVLAVEIQSGETRYRFAGWGGAISGSDANVSVSMDAPKEAVAMWEEIKTPGPVDPNYSLALLVGGLIALLACVALLALMKRRRARAPLPHEEAGGREDGKTPRPAATPDIPRRRMAMKGPRKTPAPAACPRCGAFLLPEAAECASCHFLLQRP